MTCGFTGTRKGMTGRQRKVLRQLLYDVSVLHLGDCVGADREAHAEASTFGITLIGHPPNNPKARAFLEYAEERKPMPYLIRNGYIAAEGVDGLIATPEGYVEAQRSGTWATVRAARSLKRHIWIIKPDGTVIEENR